MGSSPVFLVPSSNSFHKPPKSQPARSTRPSSRPSLTQGTSTAATTTLSAVRSRRNPPPKQARPKPRLRTEDDLAAIWSTGPCDLPSNQNGFLKRLLLCEKVLGDKRIDKHPQSLQPPPTPTPLKPLILLERYGLSATPTPTSTSTSSRSQLSGQPDLMMVSKMAGSKIRRPGSIVNKRASRVSSGPEKSATHISTLPAGMRKRVIEREADVSSCVPLRQPTAQTHKKSVSLGQNPNSVRRSARAPTRKVEIESAKTSSRVFRSASKRTASQSNASTTSVLEERSNQAREDRMKTNDIVSNDNEVSEELAALPGDVAKLETVGSSNEPMGCVEEVPSLGCDDRGKSSSNKENENENENESHNMSAQKPIISPSPSLPVSISTRISLLTQFSQQTSVSHNHPLIGPVHLRKPHLPELPDGSRASRNETTQREIDALRTMKRVEIGGVALIKGRVLGGDSASKINVLNSTE
ncbi:hypothetical protein QCA50_009163 [Cerrena zonata]|uniref:Uncharacterized protein n=1 Tax=Cerrena zonata TaxID=2478898 RepID=A0AAW0G8M4_9APHY